MSDNKDSLRDQQHAFFQTPQQKGDASVSPISNQPGGTNKKRSRVGIVSIIIVLILALWVAATTSPGVSMMVVQSKYPAQTGDRHTWCDPIFSDTFQNNTAQWNTNPPAGARITLAMMGVDPGI